jgi:hypothetical protein
MLYRSAIYLYININHFIYFGSIEVSPQSFTLAGTWPHKPCLQAFFSLVTFEIGSHFSSRLAWTMGSPPKLTPHIAGISGAHSPPPAMSWDRVSKTFCLGWPWSLILLISTSQVAGSIGMNHQHLVWGSSMIFLNA